MKKTDYLGIDISKSKLDVCLYGSKGALIFDNNLKGFKKMKSWLFKELKLDTGLIVCFEHTGIYAIALQFFLEREDIDYIQVSGLEVKRSLGLQRGKNDRIDAGRLAEYIYLHRETKEPKRLESEQVIHLKHLLSLRSRLVRQRAGYKASIKEYITFLSLKKGDVMIKTQRCLINDLTKHINQIEDQISKLINQHEKMHHQYQMATSVKGIGTITAAYMIAYTNCFKEFKKWRKFACYVGSAPFEYSSGVSIHGKTRVSNYANKSIKTVLTNAALAAIVHDPEIRQYYQRLIAAGKHKKIVINNVRNKLISRVFATVNRGTPYVCVMKYAA